MIKELTSFPKRARTIDWEDGKLIFDGDKVMLMPELSVEVMQQIGAYPALVGFHVKHYPLTDEQIQPLAGAKKMVNVGIEYAELTQHHPMRVLSEERKEAAAYIGKALSFVRKMQKFLTTPQVPPLSYLPSSAETPSDNPAPPLQWTGNAIDLVELIYGIYEMGCINNGEMPLKQLAPLLYRIFGVEAKDCYRFYIDIKRRKTISHTHFLEQMQEKLNERIRRDEEAELKRR